MAELNRNMLRVLCKKQSLEVELSRIYSEEASSKAVRYYGFDCIPLRVVYKFHFGRYGGSIGVGRIGKGFASTLLSIIERVPSRQIELERTGRITCYIYA